MGCAAGTGHYGITTPSGERCACADIHKHAKSFDWWASENPVMVPLRCRDTEYWTVMRPPIERVLSRLFKPLDGNRTKYRFITVNQARKALGNTTRFPPNHMYHEFTGSAGLDNWHVRSLAGPHVFNLSLGALNDTHLELAKAELARFQWVVPMSNLSDAPIWLRRLLGVCIRVDSIDMATAGSHSASSPWHHAQREAAMRDSAFVAAVEAHNRLDQKLYEHARALYETTVHHLRRRTSDPCAAATADEPKVFSHSTSAPLFLQKATSLVGELFGAPNALRGRPQSVGAVRPR